MMERMSRQARFRRKSAAALPILTELLEDSCVPENNSSFECFYERHAIGPPLISRRALGSCVQRLSTQSA